MAEQQTSRFWARWLPPTFAAALVAALLTAVEIWQTGDIADAQRAQNEQLQRATLSSQERRALAQLELQGGIASRDQQLALLGIVAERLLSPDAAERERAVQLLEAVDSELARKLANNVKKHDTSPRVRAAAKRIEQLVCVDASWSPMSDEHALAKAARANARQKCRSSIPRDLKRGGLWRAELERGAEVWCTCLSWGEGKKTTKDRRDPDDDI